MIAKSASKIVKTPAIGAAYELNFFIKLIDKSEHRGFGVLGFWGFGGEGDGWW